MLITIVMGVFFFVQVQSSFMYYAYGYDYAHASSVSVSKKQCTSCLQEKHADNQKTGYKLNKRYQTVEPYAILPIPVVIEVYHSKVRAKWLIPPVLASTHFLYIKPLRGPPVV